jgi:hypothetical protein
VNHDESIYPAAHATAKITVQSSEVRTYDQMAGPKLVEIHIAETFAGDIEGQGMARALEVLRDDRSASFVAMNRFRGRLGGREGTFVLQGPGIVERGKVKATWLVSRPRIRNGWTPRATRRGRL